ncbi:MULTISPECIES: DUF4278 domain-containing protein [Aphanothece]|uniref:DUF4278 domain-containing protein n=1 Tax=Aphanothece TaxID=1121 RepID=UPI0039846B8C
MSDSKLRYRGIPYNADQHEHPSAEAVEHTYRGRHFFAPLRHEAAPVDPLVELQYRGTSYHHHSRESTQQANGHA